MPASIAAVRMRLRRDARRIASAVQGADVRIGIVGDGVVGGALAGWFASRGVDTRSYDPPKGLGTAADLDAADVIFVCVPTPYDEQTGFDGRHLGEAIAALRGEKLVVIKSTVVPGTTHALQARYPQHRFVFNPEFLREAHAMYDMAHPDRQIIGVTERSRGDADVLLSLLPDAPFVRICGAREAEMAKYAANSFLAVKVSFANEVFDLCERTDVDFDTVRTIVGADPRIGASHLDVFADGYRGYGGKCLPKDSKTLLDLAADAGVHLDVLAAADASNERLRRLHQRSRRTRTSTEPLQADAPLPERRAA